MGRKPRLEFAGAFYPIIRRGNRAEPIYQDEDGRNQKKLEGIS